MNDEFDRVLRDGLAAEVADVEARVDGPSRLQEQLRRRRRRQRGVMAAAAATVLVLVGVIGVVLSQDDDDSPVMTEEPPATSADPTPTTAPETTEPEAAADAVDPRDASGPRPAQAVATTDDGRLVVVDADTGGEVRELARAGAEADYQGATSSNFIDAVEVSPDGSTVYYSTCCEPAPGVVFRVPFDGSAEPTQLDVFGAYPDLRPPAGDQLVVSDTIGIHAHDVPIDARDASGGNTSPPRQLAESPGGGAHPFWLGPTSLAFHRSDPDQGSSIAVVSGADTDTPDVAELAPDDETGWEHPVGTDAVIIVAEQCCTLDEGDTATGRIVDPSTGEILESFDLDRPVADFDLRDQWLLVTYDNGDLASIDLSSDPVAPERLASSVTNAAWVPVRAR